MAGNLIVPQIYRLLRIHQRETAWLSSNGTKSMLIEHPLNKKMVKQTSDNFRWSASVAAFGMIMRDSEFKGSATLDEVVRLAKSAKGVDDHGYRTEFIQLVTRFQLMVM